MIISSVRIHWISEHKGYGLFATEDIPKGTITFVQDGLDIVISEKQFENMEPGLIEYIEKYSYEDYLGNRVISWDLGKYMNHDDNPNTLSTGYGFEIAIKDIKAGEEVTDDYRIFSTHHDTDFSLGPKKLETIKSWPKELINSWNENVKQALIKLETVKQPLAPFVTPEIYQEAINFKSSPQLYRSVEDSLPLRYQLQTGKFENKVYI